MSHRICAASPTKEHWRLSILICLTPAIVSRADLEFCQERLNPSLSIKLLKLSFPSGLVSLLLVSSPVDLGGPHPVLVVSPVQNLSPRHHQESFSRQASAVAKATGSATYRSASAPRCQVPSVGPSAWYRGLGGLHPGSARSERPMVSGAHSGSSPGCEEVVAALDLFSRLLQLSRLPANHLGSRGVSGWALSDQMA